MARPRCNFDTMPAPVLREIDVGSALVCWNKNVMEKFETFFFSSIEYIFLEENVRFQLLPNICHGITHGPALIINLQLNAVYNKQKLTLDFHVIFYEIRF